jgi:hypothetical protein
VAVTVGVGVARHWTLVGSLWHTVAVKGIVALEGQDADTPMLAEVITNNAIPFGPPV